MFVGTITRQSLLIKLFYFPGNAVYGHSIMNKAKHYDVGFCDFDAATKLVNDPRFVSIDEFEDDCFEVTVFLLLFYFILFYFILFLFFHLNYK